MPGPSNEPLGQPSAAVEGVRLHTKAGGAFAGLQHQMLKCRGGAIAGLEVVLLNHGDAGPGQERDGQRIHIGIDQVSDDRVSQRICRDIRRERA